MVEAEVQQLDELVRLRAQPGKIVEARRLVHLRGGIGRRTTDVRTANRRSDRRRRRRSAPAAPDVADDDPGIPARVAMVNPLELADGRTPNGVALECVA